MKPQTSPKPPSHLSKKAKEQWRRIVEAFQIDDEPGRMLLTSACEAYDRLAQARAELKRDGISVIDRWGQRKQHPSVLTEASARSQMHSALRLLNMDVNALN